MTRTPDFLIIGAMKAGTTTLYRDLAGHPQLFLPEEKEPETLTKFGDDDDQIRSDFDWLFRSAPVGALRGEASTAYTKRPDYEGVAERAKRICGPHLKLIYLTRDPIKRTISQYKHDIGQGYHREPFSQAIIQYERYIAYSRYDWQLQPWIETFGSEALLRLRFEDYVVNRGDVLREICKFLRLDADLLPQIDTNTAFNASDGKPIARSRFSRQFIQSRFYQRTLKPLIPKKYRDAARNALPVRAEPFDVVVSQEDMDYLRTKFADDRY